MDPPRRRHKRASFDSRGLFVAQLGLAGLVASFGCQEEVIVKKLKFCWPIKRL